MKTILIIIIICALLYAYGISQETEQKPAPRNRSEENAERLRAWLTMVDDWQQDCPEHGTALRLLYNDIETALKFGCTAKELTALTAQMKHFYKLTNKS